MRMPSISAALFVLALAGCAPAADVSVADDPATEEAAAVDTGLSATRLVSASLDPEEAAAFPSVAVDEAELRAMVAALEPSGRDLVDLAVADPADGLIAAFDLGECTVGGAPLVLTDGALSVEGRTSDGVCEAINHEVQVWQVPWAQIPDGTTVAGRAVRAP